MNIAQKKYKFKDTGLILEPIFVDEKNGYLILKNFQKVPLYLVEEYNPPKQKTLFDYIPVNQDPRPE